MSVPRDPAFLSRLTQTVKLDLNIFFRMHKRGFSAVMLNSLNTKQAYVYFKYIL